jgi:hypothetical protein
MKEKVENVQASSTHPNTCITTIFANLKNLKKECRRMWEAIEMHQSRTKGLTRNVASIAMATLNYIMILKTLDYMSKTFANIIAKQILATSRSRLASKVLTCSKSFLE